MNLEFYTKGKIFFLNPEDIEQILLDLSELIDVFGYLLNVLNERNIDKNKFPIVVLLTKYIIHINSIITLMKGTLLESKLINYKKEIIDVSSIYTLTRTVIENYLTFFYLFIQPKSIDEEYFRYNLLKLAGLQSRQRFKADTEEHINLMKKEKNEIIELENIIYNHPLFLKLDKKMQNNIKYRKSARMISWEKLFEEADLNVDLFAPGWILYSEYAHSEYVAQNQLNGYFSDEQSSLLANGTVSNLLFALTSVLIYDLKKIFKKMEEGFNSLDDDIKNVIKFFNGVGRK